MRTLVVILVGLCVAAPATARAQDEHRVVKIIVGAGALVTGVAVMATSSQTTTVNSIAGTAETSTFSKSQLITGAALAGVGGIVLWDGLREHDRDPRAPSTQVIVSAGKKQGLFIRRVW